MKAKAISTKFSFVLSNQQTLANVEHLLKIDYDRFCRANQVGLQILSLAKENEWELLQKLTDDQNNLLPFLKLQIEEAFVTALNFRHYETVRYFLENGFKIGTVAEDAPLSVSYSLEYLKQKQAPVQLLQLVLSFGANARLASDRESNTALHVAAEFGNVTFLKLLSDYGADINAVNDERETPLAVAIKHKQQAAVDFLRQKGGHEKWNQ